MKKAVSCLADPYLEALVRRLLPYEPERVILFGSRARGEADEYSERAATMRKCWKPRVLS